MLAVQVVMAPMVLFSSSGSDEMAFGKLLLKPGIDTRLSQSAAKGGWYACQLIRWLGGLPQKLGGWLRLTSTALIGVARELHIWADLNGVAYLAAGTNSRLQLFLGGLIYDITPVLETTNSSPDFSTQMGLSVVSIHDPGHSLNIGDWVVILVPVSVGGLIIQGYYPVSTVIDIDNYEIMASGVALSTVSHGGAVPSFVSVNGNSNLTVTFDSHGLSNGDLFEIQVATTVGGITMGDFSSYPVSSVTTNTFVITPGPAAGSNDTQSENGGDARIEYLIPSGFVSNTPLTGYGVGDYGAGDYGISSGSGIIGALRLWFLDHWGQNLIGCYNGSPIYQWVPPDTNIPAQVIATSPTMNNGSFVMAPAQILVAWGSETGSVQDPNLLRWCDVADNTDWIASATNQAGSYRIPHGSMIVGAIFTAQQAMIWTDTDLWSMTYQNLPFVFGFNHIGSECGLISPKGAGIIGGQVFWLSPRGVFTLGSNGAQPINCPVWDQVFGNLDLTQAFKIEVATNTYFNEISWHYPSISGGTGENDSYIKLNVLEGEWDYGSLVRTAWFDESVLGSPIGVDQNNLLQQHEISNDADGLPLMWFVESGFTDIGEGEDFSFVDQIYPDVSASTTAGAQLQVTLKTTRFIDDTPAVVGPYTQATPNTFISCRARGRQMAVRFGTSDLGSFVRLGAPRFRFSRDGRNG